MLVSNKISLPAQATMYGNIHKFFFSFCNENYYVCVKRSARQVYALAKEKHLSLKVCIYKIFKPFIYIAVR